MCHYLKKVTSYQKGSNFWGFADQREMEETEQYFGYLFSKWRKVKESDLSKTHGEVQDEVLRTWLERGGGEGGSRDTMGQCDGGGAGVKKVKKTRDPDEPKQPLSSFLLFRAEKEAEVKKELPSLGPRDIMKELGKRWRLLEKEEKEVYLARAAQLALAYKEEMASYRAQKESQSVT